MILPSERPQYAPPRYLTADSLLTAEQLVSEYEEFSKSLRYVFTVPELVFERVVASLKEAFTAALELERQKNSAAGQKASNEAEKANPDPKEPQGADTDRGTQNAILQKFLDDLKKKSQEPKPENADAEEEERETGPQKSPNAAGKKTLGPEEVGNADTEEPGSSQAVLQKIFDSLKRTISEPKKLEGADTVEKEEDAPGSSKDSIAVVTANNHTNFAAEPRKNQNPVVGEYRSVRIGKEGYNERSMKKMPFTFDSVRIPLVSSYSSPPDIPITITNILPLLNQCMFLKTTEDCIEIPAATSALSELNIGINWLEIGAGDIDFQSGKISSASSVIGDQSTIEMRVLFQRPYTTIPIVTVWLNYFVGFTRVEMKTFVTDVTMTGFRAHVLKPRPTNYNPSYHLTWVSYPGNRPGVFKGRFSTMDIRPWNGIPQSFNGGYQRFDGSGFASSPRIFLGLDSVDVLAPGGMTIDIDVANVTEAGMSWQINAGRGTELYSAGVSYLAFS